MFKTELSYENWDKNYRYNEETPLETWQRVARSLAEVEEDPDYWYSKFLNTIVKFVDGDAVGLKFTTGGRITANIGTEFKSTTLLNCYINGPVKGAKISYERKTDDGDISYPVTYETDESPDDLVNIFLTIMEQAKTLASEGGYGTNFDFIRPRGSLIKGTGIRHPGVVSYMKIWDASAACIVKGDNDGYTDKIINHLEENGFTKEKVKKVLKKITRKGAMMGSLSCWHPDIEEFIRAKQTSGVLTKFNISVGIDDALMIAVINDEMYDLHFNGVVYKRVRARDLYNLIMECTYNRAEPGCLFLDNMMKNNPIAYLGRPRSTNPCIVGSSLIATADGRNAVSIEQLANEGKDVEVYSRNIESGIFEIKMGRNPRKTGVKKEVWKLTLDDGSTLIATPDHKMILRDGTNVKLKDLKEGQDLLPNNDLIRLCKVKSIEFYGYEDVFNITVDDNHNYYVLLEGTGVCIKNCGEIPGLDTITSVCLLGSTNLTQYVSIVDGDPVFNWEEYKEDVAIATRMLDNVNSIAKNPIPSYQWATENLRQIGFGINGLGSALMMLKIPYNSEKAVDFTKQVVYLKENICMQTTALLAKEKGTFLAYNKEKYENTEYFKSDRLTEEIKDLLRKYGARNAKTTTNPPLGNSSFICNMVTNGIEPCFLLEYERKKIAPEWPKGLTEENVRKVFKNYKEKDFEYWRGKYGNKEYYYEPHNRGLCEVSVVRDFGYQWLLDNFPDEDHSSYAISTRDLKIEDHLNIQEVVQFYCNQSVSKTCSVPNEYPFEDFKNLYIDAWKKGLNGFTTYREGSMESVMSDIKKAEKTKEIISKDIKLPPEFNNGPTKIIKREGAKFYLHFSYLPEDEEMEFPVALWIYTNQKEKGSTVICNSASRKLAQLALRLGVDPEIINSALMKAREDYPSNRLGRMVSLCLRHNIQINEVYAVLIGIEGDNVSTLLTAVRKFLTESMGNGTKLTGVKCPQCGSSNMQIDGGCPSCLDCGSSNCG